MMDTGLLLLFVFTLGVGVGYAIRAITKEKD